MRNDNSLWRKGLKVLSGAPNFLIRSYLQPCTQSMWRMKGILWFSLSKTMNAKNGKIFSPDLLITLRIHVYDQWRNSAAWTSNLHRHTVILVIVIYDKSVFGISISPKLEPYAQVVGTLCMFVSNGWHPCMCWIASHEIPYIDVFRHGNYAWLSKMFVIPETWTKKMANMFPG